MIGLVHHIDTDVFFGAASGWAGLRDMQQAAFQTQQALEITMLADHVRVALVHPAPASSIVLSGHWRSPHFTMVDLDSAAIKLLTPFLFQTSAVTLPADQIYTCGESYRSVADFVMRNVFLASCRNTPMRWMARPPQAGHEGPARDLQRQYYYIIKSIFNEPEFAQRRTDEAIDFMVANTYLPVLDLTDPLLRQACQRMRDMHAQAQAHTAIPHMLSQLKAARADLINHL